MDAALNSAIQQLKSTFSVEASLYQGQSSVSIGPDQIVEACKILKEEHGFELLVGLTAVDYWPEREPRFHIIYQFLSISKNIRLEVRVMLDGDEPHLPSVHRIYPSANWYERELWDMFGIRVEEHPDLRRILMPEDWEGHPLRKDYPLDYEEVQFTFNFEEIDLRKPRPSD